MRSTACSTRPQVAVEAELSTVMIGDRLAHGWQTLHWKVALLGRRLPQCLHDQIGHREG